MLDITTIVVLFITFIVAYMYNKARKPSGMPPGPWGLPFIGNLSYLLSNNKQFHLTLEKLNQKYGGIVGLQFLHQPIVVISDVDLQREAFIKMESVFSNRPGDVPVWKAVVKGRGIVMTNGDTWRLGRRMMIRAMRDVGMGKSVLDEVIQKEATYLVEEMASRNEDFINLKWPLHMTTLNIIYHLLLGKRCSYSDVKFNELLRMIERRFINGGFQNIFQFLPVYCLPLAPILRPQTVKGYSIDAKIRQMLKEEIETCRSEYDHEHTKSFFDVFTQNAKSSSEQKYFSDENLIQIMTETFLAGADSTANTLLWAIVFLCENQVVQERCRKDILDFTGSNGPLKYKDRVHLPYIEATLYEVQRLANVVALSVPYYTLEPVKLGGYLIPRDSFVIMNTYHAHMNPTHWTQPKDFKPDRFLTEGGELIRSKAFMPFGIGPRACPGEELAKAEVFMFLTSLLKNFRFEAAPGCPLPNIDKASLGSTLGTGEFKVKVSKVDK